VKLGFRRYIPFAKAKTERLAAGDPRPSLEERYGNQAGYVAAVRAAAERWPNDFFCGAMRIS
jgi:hypothetical protein